MTTMQLSKEYPPTSFDDELRVAIKNMIDTEFASYVNELQCWRRPEVYSEQFDLLSSGVRVCRLYHLPDNIVESIIKRADEIYDKMTAERS